MEKSSISALNTGTSKIQMESFLALPQNQPSQIYHTQFYACLQMHKQNYTSEIHIYEVIA